MRRVLCFGLLALAGCFPHRLVEHPRIPAPEDFPRQVRVVRTDGTVQDLILARIDGDTVRGEAWDHRQFAIATAQIQRLEMRRFSGRRTLVLFAVPTALFILLTYVLVSEPVPVS